MLSNVSEHPLKSVIVLPNDLYYKAYDDTYGTQKKLTNVNKMIQKVLPQEIGTEDVFKIPSVVVVAFGSHLVLYITQKCAGLLHVF